MKILVAFNKQQKGTKKKGAHVKCINKTRYGILIISEEKYNEIHVGHLPLFSIKKKKKGENKCVTKQHMAY